MTTTSTPAVPSTRATPPLSLTRLHLLRAGYLLMAVGLALVKWPQLGDAHALPLYEGVTLCLLTAMSLLALVGLRHPVTMLPVLLLEVTWKVLWLTLVALPTAVTADLDQKSADTVVSCSLVVVIVAVIPWRHVWRTYLRSAGARWR